MHLAKSGIRFVIVERDTSPRYYVSQSMTGECGLLLRDLGLGTECAKVDTR